MWIQVMLPLALVCGGCEPIKPEDRAFFEEQERIRGEKLAGMRAANVGVSIEDVILRVRQYPAAEGEGSMEDWIGREMAAMGGQVMFPRWNAIRRGSNIQQVTFEFILLADDGKMQRYRFSWDVDILDMTVDAPRLEELEQIESPGQRVANQHLRRVQEYEQELR